MSKVRIIIEIEEDDGPTVVTTPTAPPPVWPQFPPYNPPSTIC